MRLPETLDEIKYRLGITTQRVMDLDEVREAQELLATWFAAAAVERWPDAIRIEWNEARYSAAWANACARWPGVEQVADALNAAERHILRKSEPLA